VKRNKRGGALILLAAAVAVSLVLFFVFRSGGAGESVVVSLDGLVVGEYPLSKDAEYVLNGGTNRLEIKNGKARMTDADCPDSICMKQGWVWRSGECITCLPNRVVVTVVKENDRVDLVI